MWLLLLSLSGALLISAACSLMEAALLSLRPSQVAAISARNPRIGKLWQRLKQDMEVPIAAILILNTAAHTIGAFVAGAQFDQLYGAKWVWIFSIVFTFLMLQFTEILPKGVGVRFGVPVALWIARPLSFLVWVLRPVVAVVHWINRPFSPRSSRRDPVATVEEIAALAGMARLSDQISTDQERIITSGMQLSRTKVYEVMRPRVDIDAMDVETDPGEIAGSLAMSGFSRVPVYEGDLDHVLGFLYIKDVLLELHMKRPIEVRRLLRPALAVPKTLGLDQLMEMFRRERTQMAIVLDEYGGTMGLVTLEDVLEKLVGNIHDEYRRDHLPEIIGRDAASWFVLGTTNLMDLMQTIGRTDLCLDLPRDVSTVGGLVQRLLDRVPVVGDRATWNDLSLEVLDTDGRRIQRLLVSTEPSSATNRHEG